MPKIRYVGQRDKSSCGPIAILNILKWAGKKISAKKNINIIRDMCKCGMYGNLGTRPSRLDIVINNIKSIKVKRTKHFAKMGEVNKHIDSGGACVMRIVWSDRKKTQGHYTLCVGRNKRGYKMVNLYSDRKTLCYANKKQMKEMLYNSVLDFNGRADPIVWFIKRK